MEKSQITFNDLVNTFYDEKIITRENLKTTITVLEKIISGDLSYCDGHTYPEDLEKTVRNEVAKLKSALKYIKKLNNHQ